jgi:hypothetical protein
LRNAKQKSSGWRPLEKRHTREEWNARRRAARIAKARRDCDRLRSWRTCPVRLCRRVRGCSGDSDPQPCMAERSPKLPETSNDDVRTAAAKSAAALPVMSAAEAAAAIKASIANAPR